MKVLEANEAKAGGENKYLGAALFLVNLTLVLVDCFHSLIAPVTSHLRILVYQVVFQGLVRHPGQMPCKRKDPDQRLTNQSLLFLRTGERAKPCYH